MEYNHNPQKGREHIFLRDHLAAHRTALANERTFLSYIRTALTFFVVGVSFVKFFGNLLIEIIGWFLIPIGIFIFIKGLTGFKKMRRLIQKEEKEPPQDSDI